MSLFRYEVIQSIEKRFPNNTLDIFTLNDFNIKLNDLVISDHLSEGSYGIIHRGIYHNRNIAIKLQIIPDDIEECANMLIELSLMHSMPHDKLVRYIGAAIKTLESSESQLIIVMEFCDRGTLRDCLQHSSLTWKQRVQLALDIAWGIVFLHENEIIHRDIKTVNVLIEKKWRAKLCDLSFSCHINCLNKLEYMFGTKDFMSPEIASGLDITLSSDIFSYGIILCEIITGKEPSNDFLHRSIETQYQINEEEIRNHLISNCPETLEALAYLCCDNDPMKRPTIHQCIEELEMILKDLNKSNNTIINESRDVYYTPRSLSDFEKQLNDLKSSNLFLHQEIIKLQSNNYNNNNDIIRQIINRQDELEKRIVSIESAINPSNHLVDNNYLLNALSKQLQSCVIRLDSLENNLSSQSNLKSIDSFHQSINNKDSNHVELSIHLDSFLSTIDKLSNKSNNKTKNIIETIDKTIHSSTIKSKNRAPLTNTRTNRLTSKDKDESLKKSTESTKSLINNRKSHDEDFFTVDPITTHMRNHIDSHINPQLNSTNNILEHKANSSKSPNEVKMSKPLEKAVDKSLLNSLTSDLTNHSNDIKGIKSLKEILIKKNS